MQGDQFITLHGTTSGAVNITANTTTEIKNIGTGFTSWEVMLKLGTVTGTSPTLNCYIQRSMRGADPTTETWTDFISMTQLNASDAQCWVTVVGSGEEMYAASDAALAAGQIRNGPVPSRVRVKFVVGGTSPVFPAQLILHAIP